MGMMLGRFLRNPVIVSAKASQIDELVPNIGHLRAASKTFFSNLGNVLRWPSENIACQVYTIGG